MAGFEHEDDARRFLADVRERFATFGLELHPDKTRLIEFGRHAAWSRAARGVGKPETFDFLGFTHICGKTKNGWFWLKRITISKRMRAKLSEINVSLKGSAGDRDMSPLFLAGHGQGDRMDRRGDPAGVLELDMAPGAGLLPPEGDAAPDGLTAARPPSSTTLRTTAALPGSDDPRAERRQPGHDGPSAVHPADEPDEWTAATDH